VVIALTRKLRRRSRVELAMLVAAVGVRICVLVLLRVARVATVQSWGISAARAWSRRIGGRPALGDAPTWAVATAAVVLPVRDSCLADALGAHLLYTAIGRPSTIRFGVMHTKAHRLRAHAWLEADGAVIVGAAGVGAFAVLE
jgi:hypothetical protein